MLRNEAKLKKILWDISSPDERKELEFLESGKDKKTITRVLEKVENQKDYEANFKALLDAFSQHAARTKRQTLELVDDLSGKFKVLTDTITTSYEKNKPFNAAGVYKDMINQLSSVRESIDKKPVPVWNWPQYASVGVRDKNFANVDPSIAPFAITSSYDDIKLAYTGSNLTTVTYYSNNKVVAALSLSYDGSNNLTDVTRTA